MSKIPADVTWADMKDFLQNPCLCKWSRLNTVFTFAQGNRSCLGWSALCRIGTVAHCLDILFMDMLHLPGGNRTASVVLYSKPRKRIWDKKRKPIAIVTSSELQFGKMKCKNDSFDRICSTWITKFLRRMFHFNYGQLSSSHIAFPWKQDAHNIKAYYVLVGAGGWR